MMREGEREVVGARSVSPKRTRGRQDAPCAPSHTAQGSKGGRREGQHHFESAIKRAGRRAAHRALAELLELDVAVWGGRQLCSGDTPGLDALHVEVRVVAQ